jgi:hypothetical protein
MGMVNSGPLDLLRRGEEPLPSQPDPGGGANIGVPIRLDDVTLCQEPIRCAGDPVHILPGVGVALAELRDR